MPNDKILFSVNEYDMKGYVFEKGIYLHFGDTRVRVADDKDGFKSFISQMEEIHKEINDNY